MIRQALRPVTVQLALFCAVWFMPNVAAAEILDKVPSPAETWGQWLGVGLVGFLLSWGRVWLGAAWMLLALMGFYADESLLLAPDIRPAVLAEAGPAYFAHGPAAFAVAGLLSMAGFAFTRRRARSRQKAA